MKVEDLDRLPFRLAEQLVRLGRGAYGRWRSGPPLAEQWAAVDRGVPGWQVEALRIALRGGAYDLAATLAREVEGRPEASALVAEAFYAVGEAERAAAQGSARPDVDEQAHQAAAHPFELLRNPQLHLALFNASRTSDPPRALAALNRFLRAHALPSCTIAPASGNLLADLRFAPPRPARSGPLVSVVMAAHRAASTIAWSVESILTQSHQNLELLVCDDASGDDTLERLRACFPGEPRLRLFSSAANQGPYNIRNHLLERARGELVTFQDADDVSLPTRIETQVRRLRRAPTRISVVGSLRVTAEGRFVFFWGGSGGQVIRPGMVSLMTARERLGRYRSARFGADLEMRELLRRRHGDRALDVDRQPHVFQLLAEGSLTRRPGSESLDDGYRSPARRAYSEAVFRRYVTGEASDADVERTLRETGNWIAPAPITEL